MVLKNLKNIDLVALKDASVKFDEAVDQVAQSYEMFKAAGLVPRRFSLWLSPLLSFLPAVSEAVKQALSKVE